MLDNLLMVDFAQDDLTTELWSRLDAVASHHESISLEHLSAGNATADGLILRLGMGADSSLFDSMPALRYVGMYGTGYGRIDTDEAKRRGIVVSNVADYSTQSVAELVVFAAGIGARDLIAEAERAASGDVSETESEGRDLATLTVGIIGAGCIGQRAIELFAALGCRVLYWSRTRRPKIESEQIVYSELAEVCARADVVSVHVAATDETAGLLDSELIGSLRPRAHLINTAPNEVIDMDAILARCGADDLRFTMDHADELDGTGRATLLATSNVLVFPPIGYATREASNRKQEVLVENIEGFVAGSPINHVNP